MEKKTKRIYDKVNRFIEMLSKRDDTHLNSFFYEIAKDLEYVVNRSEQKYSDFGLYEYENAKLRYENEKLRRILNVLVAEQIEEISDDEIRDLERFSHGKYYTAKSFFDTLNKIRSVKFLNNFFYPGEKRFPKNIEDLTNGETILNKKLWSLN